MFMSIKLTDAQIFILSAAAQRDDRCLIAPRNLKGGAAQKVAAKLIAGGLAKEIKAKPGAPVWRQSPTACMPRSSTNRLGIASNVGLRSKRNQGRTPAEMPGPFLQANFTMIVAIG
jgi:hypothetical protein